MDHSKILASALGLSIVIALVILGTGNAAAVGTSTGRWSNPLASAVYGGQGSNGWTLDTAKPPIQPNGSVAAKPNVTVTLGMWRNMRPTESYLNDVSLLPPTYSVDCQTPGQLSKGWIVADSGTLLQYCNGVWDQAIIPFSLVENLMGVQAISPTLSVAVGEQGTILLYLFDYTANSWVWTKSPIPIGNVRLSSVSMSKRSDGSYFGWAVGMNDPNYGGKATLIQGTINAPSGPITPTHTYEWVNVTNDYALPPAFSYFMVQTLAPDNSWAVGGVTATSGGVIIHWNGTAWSVFQNVADPLYALKMKSASEGWAVGRNGGTYRFDGSTWSKVPSPTTEILHGIDYAPTGEPWAVGYNNTLMRYVGGSWQQTSTEDLRSDAYDFRGVDFTSGRGWLVGAHYSKGIGGQILEYDSGLWLPVTPPTDNRLNAIYTVSDNDVWAVGAPDSSGGTIVHWDGRHWQRWYQRDLPIPAVELFTISMASATDGWAAGDPKTPGAPAVFLHWDGRRWAEPRALSPLNARVNGLDVYKTGNPYYPVYAWAVAESGNAFAYYQTSPDQWTGLHSCGASTYEMFGVSIIPGSYPPVNWDGWAVGRLRSYQSPFDPLQAVFLKFTQCGSSSAWDWYQDAPREPNANTRLYGIKMMPGSWGYAGGNQDDKGTIYAFNTPLNLIADQWERVFMRPADNQNPSNFYSVGIDSSQVTWLGGYYSNPLMGGKKWVWLNYIDAGGRHPIPAGQYILPKMGINVYHRPIKNIQMGSSTMGWAVGDPEDPSPGGKSVVYQYPFPNFTLNAVPPARAVPQTGSTSFTVNVVPVGGFTGNVLLSLVLPLPTGISATINQSTINPEQSATITVNTSGAALRPDALHPDPYCIGVRGDSTINSGDLPLSVTRQVCLNLYVTNHPVYSVTPDRDRFGRIVTITGTGFGADPGAGSRSTASNHISWTPTNWPLSKNVQMPDSAVLTWSNTQITFRPPDTPALFTDPLGFTEFPMVGRVKVTVGGTDSNDNFTFKMDPWISNLSASAGAGVITITLAGTSFGDDPGSLNRSTNYEHVAVDGISITNSNVKSWSNKVIVFTVPLTSPGGTVTVTTNGFESNAVGFGNAANKEFLPLLTK